MQKETLKKLLSCSTLILYTAATTFASEPRRFSLGGYGEAVMTRNFFSQDINRYNKPYDHKDDPSYGRFDLPHITINMGYNFGKGWTMGMEIEFEHGGTESAVEYEADESGEYEAEIEKGGEVALEQFWINKAFFDGRLNIKAGEIIVPIGYANAYHLPNEFFTVYRPEGESTILPNTWHQTGLSLWGKREQWRYEMQFLSGLDSERFGAESFVHYGATSPYEFKIANKYAFAGRLDYFPMAKTRIGISGYYGYTFRNTLSAIGSKYDGVEGALAIGSADFQMNRWNWIIRGNATYAHLADADYITAYNNTLPLHHGQDGSPSKHQPVAKNAISLGMEGGYNIFSQFVKFKDNQKLYIFGRYEYYHSMAAGTHKKSYDWCGKNRMALGINYHPVKEVIIKAEYSKRYLNHMSDEAANAPCSTGSHSGHILGQYNDEPSISIGVTYCGWFL